MRATAAVVHGRGQPFVVEPIDVADPGPDQVLVRLVATGICHTDMAFRDMFPWSHPMVFGHEGAGIVERAGVGVTHLTPGDHVVLTFDSCGRCRRCARGKPSYCEEFRARNFGARFFGQSSFASHALATGRNAIKVPADLSLERLGPLGCGIQTGAGAILNSLRVPAGSSVAVFGAGAVGISAVMAARVAGATTVIAVDIRRARLDLARQLGATHAVDAAETDAGERVRALTRGGADYTVETTGIQDVLQQAVVSLAPLGVCGMIAGAEAPVLLPWREVLYGRTLRGIIEGDSVPGEFIPTLIELFRQGRFPFDRLERFYPFRRINEAAADSLAGDTVKPILRFAD
ncbi:MAG TPA: NAD(P)-dependent alcohol dehydrogenase [Candidatus Methylomirabilis sp.]|nr:NAD(P)-dependent alcohol dehydrogenase [Candidatus Methylomirabilis sp.]